jgi:hypothetical protein
VNYVHPGANPGSTRLGASLHDAVHADLSRWWDWAAGLFLFLATSAVVVWQNSRLAVLWDLSYILESSYRISVGDIPYRDFVLPFAPLTFLTQAALIKLTGRVFFHHVIYCAVVGGLATVITWRIILNVFRGTLPGKRTGPAIPARLVAFLLSVPLIVLGIYCIFPHPFYDPDCTFAILVCVLLLQELGRRNFPPVPAFFVGAALVIPLFVKQNTGLAFLAAVGLGLAVLIGLGARRGLCVRGYAWIRAGAAAGLASAILLIHRTVGLANYIYWTIEFAASRRMPPFHDVLAVYGNELLPWWIAAFAGGALVSWFNRRGNRVLAFLSCSLMELPFAWTAIYLLIDKDSSERAERLLALWPFLLIVSFVLALASIRRRAGVALVLPFILICTVHGAFLSQQLWGSTYALWPLFVVLLACTIEVLVVRLNKGAVWHAVWELVLLTSVMAMSMTIAGGFYVWSHERLDYANLAEGELVRSSLPALAGLSVRGPWVPQFEELVRFTEREIPREDGLLMIPGEDIFYYTTGRHPRFPVLMFDHTVNPLSPEEIQNVARARRIGWLIIKRYLQLGYDPVEDRARLMELLLEDFTRVESLDNYDIYQRK